MTYARQTTHQNEMKIKNKLSYQKSQNMESITRVLLYKNFF